MITSTTTPQLEIPCEMRVVAQRSIEQAQLAFANYMRMTWDASSRLQARAGANQLNVRAVRHKSINFIVQNMTSRFEFCQRLVQVNDAGELLRLLSDFLRSQTQILNEQMIDPSMNLSKVAVSRTPSSQETEYAA